MRPPDHKYTIKEKEMLYELYTQEKMRELESEARARTPDRMVPVTRLPFAARLLRFVGRRLRRLGAGLEDWGECPPATGCCEACG
jgi:hypothetical protein